MKNETTIGDSITNAITNTINNPSSIFISSLSYFYDYFIKETISRTIAYITKTTITIVTNIKMSSNSKSILSPHFLLPAFVRDG